MMVRCFLSALLILAVCGVASLADDLTVGTQSVLVTAQDQAAECARTGVLKHCRLLGGVREGIGFSTAGPEDAVRRCCFYQDAVRGRYRIVERAVAWSPIRRGWFAVIRLR